MQKNIGTTDRVIRISVALVIGLTLLMGTLSGAVAVLLGIIAVTFLLTSAISICPLYIPFRISTRRQNPSRTR